jgi:hypothetical protein
MGPHAIVRLRAALTVLLWALGQASAPAQTASAPALHAAFVFNFAKFTEWPPAALPPVAPLVICVLGDPAAAAAFDQAVYRQTVQGHRVVVRQALDDGSGHACHVLFIGRSLDKSATALLEGVKGNAVLTVSESPAFAETGGAIQIFTENDRMRFAINNEAAQRQGLRLSAQLLSLARIVRTKDAQAH